MQNWKSRTGCSTPDAASPAASREDYLPRPAGVAFPNAAQDTVDPFCHKDALLVHGRLLSTSTPWFFLAKLLSNRLVFTMYWYLGLFLLRCRTFHFLLFNFMRVFSFQFFSLLMSWRAGQPCWVSATLPSCVSSANLLRVHSVPLSRPWL